MRINLLVMLVSVFMFSTMASADIITFAIHGSTADFSGQLYVNSLSDTILLNPAAGFGNSSDNLTASNSGTVTFNSALNQTFQMKTFGLFLNEGIIWNPAQADRFLVRSSSLNAHLAGNTYSTWNDLIGTYSLNDLSPTLFSYQWSYIGNNTGGSITFGDGSGGGGASAVPEPGTVMLMGSGVLGMLGFRRRELLAYFKK